MKKTIKQRKGSKGLFKEGTIKKKTRKYLKSKTWKRKGILGKKREKKKSKWKKKGREWKNMEMWYKFNEVVTISRIKKKMERRREKRMKNEPWVKMNRNKD